MDWQLDVNPQEASTRTQGGKKATKDNPCPGCKRFDDWCFHIDENTFQCSRTEDPPPDYELRGIGKDGRKIFGKIGRQKQRKRKSTFPEIGAIVPLTLDSKTDGPRWEPTGAGDDKGHEIKIEYLYENDDGEVTHRVVRTQYTDRRKLPGGSTKNIRPWHKTTLSESQIADGCTPQWVPGEGTRPFPLYRAREVREAVTNGQNIVFYVAGEQAVEDFRELGSPAFTNQGGEGRADRIKQIVAFLQELRGINPDLALVIWPDFDDAGAKNAQRLLTACRKNNIPALLLSPPLIWPDMPLKGDVHDLLEKSGLDKSTIIERLEAELERAYEEATEVEEAEPERKPKIDTTRFAAKFCERERERLAFNLTDESWYRYDSTKGIWIKLKPTEVQGVIAAELEAKYSYGYAFKHITEVANLARLKLHSSHWDEQPGLLPLQNGVLDLQTKKLRPHSPGDRFTWQLPFSYDDSATCEPIREWLQETAGGDQQLVRLLLACLNAVVRGRSDLQRFIELLGPGGTGKSTFINLAIDLIGAQNTYASSLSALENNRFETAGAYGKRLVYVTDSERYGGSVSILKSMTGGDPLRLERKGVQQEGSFVYGGMVIIAANEAIQSSDYTSGLSRRRLTIPFTNKVSPEKQRDLRAEFRPYLPGLLNLVLSIPDEEVTRLVKRSEVFVPSLATTKITALLESNPIAGWLDERVIYSPKDPEIKTYVGVATKDTLQPGGYKKSGEWLYASYKEYCDATGCTAMSQKRFSPALLDLCRNTVGLEVTSGKDRRGSYFTRLRLRSPDDIFSPRPISDQEGNKNPSEDKCAEPVGVSRNGSVMGRDGSVMGSVMAETLAGDGCDGCDGSFRVEPGIDQKNNQLSQPPPHPLEADGEQVHDDQENLIRDAGSPVTPVTSVTGAGLTHHATHHTTPLDPSQPITAPPSPTYRYIGSKCPAYQGIPLRIQSRNGSGDCVCIKPDGYFTAAIPFTDLEPIQAPPTGEANPDLWEATP